MIEPEPQSGVRNMAFDEALLERALEGECTVRWYRWDEATVSLGYFQEDAGATDVSGLGLLPTVRRLTGGGAILHHHEWTYSCAVPSQHPLTQDPSAIYALVHRQIIAALAEQGLAPALRGEAGRTASTEIGAGKERAFLCFGRGDPRDVIFRGHKIVGSAQRRRRGAVLQHGSVLLRRSEHAAQFPGILDLAPQASFDEGTVRGVAEAMGSLFGAAVITPVHEGRVEERAAELEPSYPRLDWR